MTDFEPDPGTEDDEEQTDEEQPDDGTEPAEPDEEAGDEETPEPDAEPDSLARIAEIDKKLEGVRKYVARKISEILGDDAAYYIEDPISKWSGVPGWMPPIDIPPDVAGELYHLLGQHAPSDYQADKHSRECPDCNGFGEVATGSKIIGQDKLPCVECNGLGWQATDEARRSRLPAIANGPVPAYAPPAREASAMPDTSAEEDPDVIRLRQLGYAVIPPMVVGS